MNTHLGKIAELLDLVEDILAIALLDDVAEKRSHGPDIGPEQDVKICRGNIRDEVVGRLISIQSGTGEPIGLEQTGIGLIEGMGLEGRGGSGKRRCVRGPGSGVGLPMTTAAVYILYTSEKQALGGRRGAGHRRRRWTEVSATDCRGDGAPGEQHVEKFLREAAKCRSDHEVPMDGSSRSCVGAPKREQKNQKRDKNVAQGAKRVRGIFGEFVGTSKLTGAMLISHHSQIIAHRAT